MVEDTVLEERMRFVELVDRLGDLDEAGFEEMFKLGVYQLGVIDLLYFNGLADIPGDAGRDLIELYLKERAYAVDGDYSNANKCKDALTEILQKRELVSRLIAILKYGIKNPPPKIIYL